MENTSAVPPARSVAGIAVSNGRLFIAKRKNGGSLGGKWEFPGGKVENGESDVEALKREYIEEFDIQVEVGPLLASTEFSSKGRRFLLNAYRVFPSSMDFKMREHTQWRWIKADEIETDEATAGNFADSDLLLLPMLKSGLSAVCKV
jgi:8-oxo-dGTP diphosphatase